MADCTAGMHVHGTTHSLDARAWHEHGAYNSMSCSFHVACRHGQRLIYGNDPLQDISYDAMYRYVKLIFKGGDIISNKKTHAGRGQGVRNQIDAG